MDERPVNVMTVRNDFNKQGGERGPIERPPRRRKPLTLLAVLWNLWRDLRYWWSN